MASSHTAAQAPSPQIQKTNDRLALHESALKTPVYVVVLLFLHFQRVKVLAKSRKKYVWNCEKDEQKVDAERRKKTGELWRSQEKKWRRREQEGS